MSNIDKAFEFYNKHIYDAEKIQLLKNNKLKVAGHVHSVIWELFGAILTGRKAGGITGADLVGWEVKSAKTGGSYEYQYHRNAHIEKLDEDCIVNHLYCSYSPEYDGLEARVIRGNELSDHYFNAWKPLCIQKYGNPANLRFRKSISYGHVQQSGLLVLQVSKGRIVYRNDDYKNVLSSR